MGLTYALALPIVHNNCRKKPLGELLWVLCKISLPRVARTATERITDFGKLKLDKVVWF